MNERLMRFLIGWDTVERIRDILRGGHPVPAKLDEYASFIDQIYKSLYQNTTNQQLSNILLQEINILKSIYINDIAILIGLWAIALSLFSTFINMLFTLLMK